MFFSSDSFSSIPSFQPEPEMDPLQAELERQKEDLKSSWSGPTEKEKIYIEKYKSISIQSLIANRELLKLKQHQKDNTVPNGLLPKISSIRSLSSNNKGKWDQILRSTANQLRNLLITHYEECLKARTDEIELVKKELAPNLQLAAFKEAKKEYDEIEERKTQQQQQQNTQNTPKANNTHKRKSMNNNYSSNKRRKTQDFTPRKHHQQKN